MSNLENNQTNNPGIPPQFNTKDLSALTQPKICESIPTTLPSANCTFYYDGRLDLQRILIQLKNYEGGLTAYGFKLENPNEHFKREFNYLYVDTLRAVEFKSDYLLNQIAEKVEISRRRGLPGGSFEACAQNISTGTQLGNIVYKTSFVSSFNDWMDGAYAVEHVLTKKSAKDETETLIIKTNESRINGTQTSSFYLLHGERILSKRQGPSVIIKDRDVLTAQITEAMNLFEKESVQALEQSLSLKSGEYVLRVSDFVFSLKYAASETIRLASSILSKFSLARRQEELYKMPGSAEIVSYTKGLTLFKLKSSESPNSTIIKVSKSILGFFEDISQEALADLNNDLKKNSTSSIKRFIEEADRLDLVFSCDNSRDICVTNPILRNLARQYSDAKSSKLLVKPNFSFKPGAFEIKNVLEGKTICEFERAFTNVHDYQRLIIALDPHGNGSMALVSDENARVEFQLPSFVKHNQQEALSSYLASKIDLFRHSGHELVESLAEDSQILNFEEPDEDIDIDLDLEYDQLLNQDVLKSISPFESACVEQVRLLNYIDYFYYAFNKSISDASIEITSYQNLKSNIQNISDTASFVISNRKNLLKLQFNITPDGISSVEVGFPENKAEELPEVSLCYEFVQHFDRQFPHNVQFYKDTLRHFADFKGQAYDFPYSELSKYLDAVCS